MIFLSNLHNENKELLYVCNEKVEKLNKETCLEHPKCKLIELRPGRESRPWWLVTTASPWFNFELRFFTILNFLLNFKEFSSQINKKTSRLSVRLSVGPFCISVFLSSLICLANLPSLCQPLFSRDVVEVGGSINSPRMEKIQMAWTDYNP